MKRFEVRWRNFRSFEDTDWIDIRPVTIIIGPNGSGKTSVLAPLLLLKQTLQSLDPTRPLKPVGDLFNAGSFLDLLPYHNPASDVTLAIRFHHHDPEGEKKIGALGEYPPGELEVTFAWQKGTSTPILSRYVVRDVLGREMLGRSRLRSGRYSLSGVNRAALHAQAVIRTASPQHFLFTGDEIFRGVFEPISKRKRHDDRVGRKTSKCRYQGAICAPKYSFVREGRSSRKLTSGWLGLNLTPLCTVTKSTKTSFLSP